MPMGGDGFRVQPEAISRYASAVREQAGQLAQIQSAISRIVISGDAFGHLPNAGHLAQTYQDHADANRRNLADLITALSQTAEGLGTTARSYAQQDQALTAGLGGGQ
jgi:uncharacterized protein YukE